MSDNYSKLVTLVLILPIFINSMTNSVKDSIIFHPDSKYLELRNNLIIESTLRITLDDSLINPEYIYPIEGKIILNGVPRNSILVVEYDCLEQNIPNVVGPKWKNFPSLDSLTISNNKS